MTRQELFDKVVKGLAAQGFVTAYSDVGCSYRDDSGRKCAIGQLIPDEKYLPEFEGVGISQLGPVVDGLSGVFVPEKTKRLAEILREVGIPLKTREDVDFLFYLQRAHDNSHHGMYAEAREAQPLEMKEKLKGFAEQFNLTVPDELK